MGWRRGHKAELGGEGGCPSSTYVLLLLTAFDDLLLPGHFISLLCICVDLLGGQHKRKCVNTAGKLQLLYTFFLPSFLMMMNKGERKERKKRKGEREAK